MAGKMRWTAEAERKLLLSILNIHKVQVDVVQVAASLSDESVTCTPIAVKRHLQVLRDTAKQAEGPNTGEPDKVSGSKSNTPARGQKRGKTGDAEGTPAKKGRKNTTADGKNAKYITPKKDEAEDEIAGAIKDEPVEDGN